MLRLGTGMTKLTFENKISYILFADVVRVDVLQDVEHLIAAVTTQKTVQGANWRPDVITESIERFCSN